MKPFSIQRKKALLGGLGAGALALLLVAGCGKKPKPAPAAAAAKPSVAGISTNGSASASKTNLSAQFVSFFDDSPPPENKGRDPFFPDSTRRNPAPPVVKVVTPAPGGVVTDPTLRLQGVAGSKGNRVATINNHIFMHGDGAESMKVPGGTVMVKVIDIGEDYVDVQVDGGETKRLTMRQIK